MFHDKKNWKKLFPFFITIVIVLKIRRNDKSLKLNNSKIFTKLCNELINWLTLQKAQWFSIQKKFLAFYGTRRYITVFKISATELYSEPDESSSTCSQPISLGSSVIFPSYLCFVLTTSIFV